MTLAEDHAERALQALEERSPSCAAILKSAPADLRQAGMRVLASSDFVHDALARDELLLPRLLKDGAGQIAEPFTVQEVASIANDESQFIAELRRWRRAELTASPGAIWPDGRVLPRR